MSSRKERSPRAANLSSIYSPSTAMRSPRYDEPTEPERYHTPYAGAEDRTEQHVSFPCAFITLP